MIEKIKNNKILMSLAVLVVGVLLILVFRIAYAYLAKETLRTEKNVVGETAEVDRLRFNIGTPLTLKATSTTLPENGSNLVVTSTPSASFTANSTNNTATTNYNLYLAIADNDFVYTTTDHKPEIILTVTNPAGTNVTSISGLTYNSTLGGFDVTTYNGVIKIAENYTITSNSSTTATTQTWTLKLTYINLATDQSANYGKEFSTEIALKKDTLAETFADVCSSGNNLAECLSTYSDKSMNAVSRLYKHDSSLVNGAEDDNYRYAGANPNNYVCFGSDSTTCPSNNLYRIIGVFDNQVKLIKDDFANSDMLGTNGDYTTLTYIKKSSNYVDYKGSLTTINRYYYNYAYGSKSSNNWETSLLNKTNLNANYMNYLNNIDSKWGNMIADMNWNVGNSGSTSFISKKMYDAEIAIKTSTKSKIGMINASDYGFAASPNDWDEVLSSYGNVLTRTKNWLFIGVYEWTLTPVSTSSYSYGPFYIHTLGRLDVLLAVNNNITSQPLRPAFYLKNTVKYNSGDGSKSSPYRVSL